MGANAMVRGIEQKIKELDVEYERIVQERNSLHIALSVFERDAGTDDSAKAKPKSPTYQYTLRQAIYETLSEQQPLHRKEILKGVKARGVKVTAEDKLRAMTYHLSRDDRFESVGRGAWQLVEDTQPETPNAGRMRLIK